MRRKRVLLFVFVMLALSGVAMSACSATQANMPVLGSGEAENGQALQTSPVRQGDIMISATGAGTIVPAEEIVIGFGGGGVLEELLVSVGQEIEAGDVLARLDATSAAQQLASAELKLAQAIMQTDGRATEAGVSFNDLSLEQAQLSLQQAQKSLDDLLGWVPDEDEIAQAQASLESAQAGYQAALGQESSSSSGITVKRVDLESAQRALAEAEEAQRIAYDPGRDWELYIDDPSCKTGEQFPNCTGQPYSDVLENERESADSALQRATDNLIVAEANYGSAVSSMNSSSSTSAQAAILNAELSLKAAQEGPGEDDILAAETAVRQAELAYQQALLNKELDEKIGVAEAELALQSAEDALADTELVAPTAGTVMAVAASPGELVGAGELVTLADLTQPLLEVYLDETDLDKIGVDYEVEVVFDALPDDTFAGHVLEIDPMLSSVNGVTTVRALVRLDEASFAKPQRLPVGLNASVEVIGGRAQNALLVPVEAVREVSPGAYAVFVLSEGGEPELRFVDVGLMDFSFAEILSGLALGETVTTGLVETN